MSQLEPARYLIRPGNHHDVLPYLRACQRSASLAYSDFPLPGLDLFAPEHYFHPGIMDYWKELTQNNDYNRWWVAEISSPSGEPVIVGGISLRLHADHSEGRGFYVAPEWQRRGIGRALWEARRAVVQGPLLFEVYAHAAGTIAYHKKNGARETGKSRLVHWESWPEDIQLTALEFVSA